MKYLLPVWMPLPGQWRQLQALMTLSCEAKLLFWNYRNTWMQQEELPPYVKRCGHSWPSQLFPQLLTFVSRFWDGFSGSAKAMGEADSWGGECTPKLQVNNNLGLIACYACGIASVSLILLTCSVEIVKSYRRVIQIAKALTRSFESRIVQRVDSQFLVKWVLIKEKSK